MLTEKQIRKLRDTKILLATPAYLGQVTVPYARSLASTIELAERSGIQFKRSIRWGGMYIELARCMFANEFMNSGGTHLIFVDADVAWKPEHFFDLVLAGKDVIAGAYPRKMINWEAVIHAVKAGCEARDLPHCAGSHPLVPLEGVPLVCGTEPVEVECLPAGFLCITRQAFQAYEKAYPTRRTPAGEGDFGWVYFLNGMADETGFHGPWLGEDNRFCHDVRAAGVKTYLAPWINCKHFGNMLYEGMLGPSNGLYEREKV